MKPVVVFLTDFGTADGFAGVLKGVALSINPDILPVDLTHDIPPFDILGGALVLKAHYRYFPKGSVFVGVVDPGVGTDRKPIAVQTENYHFVGPMNGLFDLVLGEERIIRAVELNNPEYHLRAVNNTFHGRDIFTPAAAYITKGVPLQKLGTPIEYQFLLDFPKVERLENGALKGKIIYFDRFGNGVTNIPCGEFKYCVYRNLKGKYVRAFLEGQEAKPNFTCGSFGFVEVFTPMGNFKEEFNARRGEEVICYPL